MKYERSEIISYIWQYSRHYGNLLESSEYLYDEGCGHASLVLLFSTLEYVSKSIVKDYESKFCNVLKKLYGRNLINKEEYDFLSAGEFSIRILRNFLTHANLSKINIIENEYAWPLTENETCTMLYKKLSYPILGIMLKLISQDLSLNLDVNLTKDILGSKITIKEFSIQELLEMKGYAKDYFDDLDISNDDKLRLIDNSSDVNVLAHIFENLLK